jgi:uncharacterized protein (DUF427 family)
MMGAAWHGAVLAASDDSTLVENDHYFPPESINWRYFIDSQTHTTYPWNGQTSYYTLVVDDRRNPDAAWVYHDPKPAACHITDRVAFWRGVHIHDDTDKPTGRLGRLRRAVGG